MSLNSTAQKPLGNHILASLPEKESKRITNKLSPFDLIFGENIYEAGDAIDNVYFPDSGIISLLATLGGESVLEVGIVGVDGVVGLSAFLGTLKSRGRAIVQGEGVAQKMTTANFLDECEASPALSKLLRQYTHSLLTQIAQSAVCYRFHKIDARLARWLLMTADCMISEEFRLTHDFLSYMLGVRREGVSNAASQLQKQGIIHYSRGNIEILDRKSLEAAACPCYAILKQDKQNL